MADYSSATIAGLPAIAAEQFFTVAALPSMTAALPAGRQGVRFAPAEHFSMAAANQSATAEQFFTTAEASATLAGHQSAAENTQKSTFSIHLSIN